MSKQGLFVGMVTLDLVYLTEEIPERNQKIVASEYTAAAGGPATNAAVAFSYLGGNAILLGAVGSHPITQLIRGDLESCGVRIADLDPARAEAPPVSSIIVTKATGDRAVVSINASRMQIPPEQLPPDPLQNVDIVLTDGHQIAVGEAIVEQAKSRNIPVAIDGGSWKAGYEKILPFVDYAICSANFYPPTCETSQDVFAYLSDIGIPHIAITNGEKPLQYLSRGNRGEVPAPSVKTVDTLGAGDIFHGAFCYYILRESFPDALASASKIAARSCQSFGTREWMRE